MNTASFLFVLSPSTKFPCSPCDPWMFLVAYGKKSFGEILFKMLPTARNILGLSD